MPEISVKQQIFETIKKANRILIPLSVAPSGDSVATALALYGFLKKLNKEPRVVCTDAIPAKFQFLPNTNIIQKAIEDSRGFVISVRTENAPLAELSYHMDENVRAVNIYLKPTEGHYEPGDVTFRSDKFPYDLVIMLDVPSLDQLGSLYDSHTDLFFETPVVNIDHHANNEHYGEINLVDITATSTAEIMLELLESFEAGLIDAEIATGLLAGIVTETNSFQDIKTTPKSLLQASNLIAMGANQQEIIRQLYKTKSVALLKLWGRALARLREVPELGLTYSLLKAEDITKSGSGDILGVMEELTASLSDQKIIVLLAEVSEREVAGYFQAHPSLVSPELTALLSAEMVGSTLGRLHFVGKTLAESEADLLGRLQRIKAKLEPAL